MGLSHQHHHDHLLLLFSCLVLLVSRPLVQSNNNISLGTSFSPPLSWPSPSGDFAFGFRALETDGTLFLLAVWFDKVPNKTVVWCANGDNPVRDGSTAQLAPSGLLLLKDQTGQVVWNTSGVATHAAMLDSGNLVLVGAKSATVWQSFDNPTDTILPTQVLGLGSLLYARLMDTDYSKGRFQLVLQNDGNLVFYPVAVPTGFRYDYYLQSGTNGSGIRLVFDEDKGSIYLSDKKNRSLFPLTSSKFVTGKHYQRASLDPDGVFRHYSLPKDSPGSGSGGWEVRSTLASEICELVLSWYGSGACGFNSYCQLDTSMRADCQCPPRYSFVDPSRKYKGCKPDFVAQSCDPGSESQYEFVNLTNVDWPLNDAEQFSPMNESECSDNCLKDCLCTVAIYREGNCWKKRQPLSNGKTGSDIGRRAFIKVSKFQTTPTIELEEENKFRRTWVLVGSLFLGCSVLLNFAQIGACFYIKNRRLPLHRNSNAMLPESTLTLRYFTYKELEEATRGFSEEVGRGAFGTVYKGFLPIPSSTVVAVKKLETLQHEAEKDFTNEVRSIGQTHHKNLVRLYGFCKEGNHRLLVYEFMSNGSLNRFLFSDGDRPEWSRRVQIALGIAGGLAYLHEECRTQIIHCDIKPQNILLDDDLTARIADFGLAKLLGIQQTRTSTGLRGTIGYFAPEWFKNIPITAKVDVYSFGVMLLEIICCRRNLNWEMGESNGEKLMLADWAIECYRNGRLNQLVEDEEEATVDAMRLERFVMVAICCVQEEPWLRPSMKKVTQMLEGAVAVSVPPNAYAAC